jgi:hypothetical protein
LITVDSPDEKKQPAVEIKGKDGKITRKYHHMGEDRGHGGPRATTSSSWSDMEYFVEPDEALAPRSGDLE